MIRLSALTFGAIVLLGCPKPSGTNDAGTDTEDLSPYRSGTRLKLAGTVGVGEGFLDSALGVRCTFMRDSTFTFRCMPRVVGGDLFEDSSCTKEVTYAGSCGVTSGELASVNVEQRCLGAPSARPVRIGAKLSASSVYGRVNGGPCTEFMQPGPTDFARLEPVDVSMFQPATVKLLGSGSFGAQALETDDGARQLLGGYSFDDQTSCTPVMLGVDAEKDPQYCIAGDLAYDRAEFVEHADCSKPVAYSVGDPRCDPPRYVLQYRLDGGTDWLGTMLTIGDELDAGAVDDGDPTQSMCGAATTTLARFWRPGHPTPSPTPLAKAFLGDGEAQPEFLMAGTTPVQPTGRWRARATGARCNFEQTVDAGWRCVPSDVANLYWADSTCTSNPVSWDVDAGAQAVRRTDYLCKGNLVDAVYVFNDVVASPPQLLYLKTLTGCEGMERPKGVVVRSGTQVPWESVPVVQQH